MTTRAPARPATTNAVVAQPLSSEDFMSLLAQSGMIATGGGGEFHRMSLKGGMLITDPGTPQEESWPPVKGGGPTMRVRIVTPPKYYNQFYCDANEANGAFDARKIGRADLNGRFLKKYDDPADQAADQYANLDAYEAAARETGSRGKFTGDIELQIVPESGQLTGEEPVYTFSMPTTTCLDFRGTSKNPNGGVVQEKNFIVQLGEFAMRQVIDANPGASRQDLAAGVLAAMTALRLGGVVADIHLLGAQSDDKSFNWTVAAFRPVFIDTEASDAPAALPDPTTVGPEQNGDDQLPF